MPYIARRLFRGQHLTWRPAADVWGSLLLIVACCACADVAEPGLRFERERVDVGRMFAGPEVPLAFPFVNGPSAIRLDQVDTSCGCVEPQLFLDGVLTPLPAEIPPGATGEIRAVYRTAGYSGRKLTGLVLRGLGARLPQQLEVDSILDLWLELDPPQIDFGAVPGDVEAATEVRVRGREPFRLTALLAGSPLVRVEGLPSAAPAREHRLRIVWLPNAEEGRQAAFLNLGTDLGWSARLGVAAEVQGRLWVRPGRLLMLGEVPAGVAASAGLEVGVREGSLEPPEVEIEGMAGVRTTVRSLEGDRRYQIDLTLPDDLPVGAFSAQILLRLRHRTQGTVEPVERTLRLLGVVRKPG